MVKSTGVHILMVSYMNSLRDKEVIKNMGKTKEVLENELGKEESDRALHDANFNSLKKKIEIENE